MDYRPQGFLYQLVTTLLNAMSSGDQYTANHQSNVSILSRRIAQSMSLSSFEIEGIRIAAQLHDIGKIAIPNELLNKVGRLHEEEFSLIKTHPARGVEILQEVEFPWAITTMVEQHHERMDGTGYPHGLQSDKICLEARIIGIADVADAMVNARPYRKALGLNAIYQEFEQACQRYDSDVLTHFFKLIEKQDPDICTCLQIDSHSTSDLPHAS